MLWTRVSCRPMSPPFNSSTLSTDGLNWFQLTSVKLFTKYVVPKLLWDKVVSIVSVCPCLECVPGFLLFRAIAHVYKNEHTTKWHLQNENLAASHADNMILIVSLHDAYKCKRELGWAVLGKAASSTTGGRAISLFHTGMFWTGTALVLLISLAARWTMPSLVRVPVDLQIVCTCACSETMFRKWMKVAKIWQNNKKKQYY